MLGRKLVLEDGTWNYRVGQHTVDLWSPSGRKILVYKSEIIAGATGWQSSDCAEHDGLTITPGLLRSYIERVRP